MYFVDPIVEQAEYPSAVCTITRNC